ncbi:hypothetical protein GCM10011418_39140 [Sphingobacterium alkalisoli]|uniref:hypothetical protein n=1 Tax=Sphingobacterium alkalisoli TaxID=1874115 RepID=UPI00145C601C|nr:hypothetical protein [Sphingobacterium alkalisoli]GGH28463.1 hypothetical protein GCM10011418_39140 [Sphingobacterium alkalisoli]
MDSKSLKALRSKLPKGGIGLIAERTQLSKAMVSSVFSGKRNNIKVVDVAFEIIEEANKEKAKRENRFKSILSK